MKQADLIRKLERAGCLLVRHGGKHDWYVNPRSGAHQPVTRHSEINEKLAKNILKQLRD